MIDCRFLRALCTLDIETLNKYEYQEVLMVLPFLVRSGHKNCSREPGSWQKSWEARHFQLMHFLLGCGDVNQIIDILNTDFNEVLRDVNGQLMYRKKTVQSGSSVRYSENLQVEFDSYCTSMQLKCVVTEVKWLTDTLLERPAQNIFIPPVLQCDAYRTTVTHLLCIALSELPLYLPLTDVVEVLLLLRDPVDLVRRVVLNVPWSISEVCKSLVLRSRDTEDSVIRWNRIEAIKALCRISISTAIGVLKICVEQNKLPQVLAWLCLEKDQGVSMASIVEFLFTHRRVAKLLLQSKGNSSAEDSELLTVVRNTLDKELNDLIANSSSQTGYTRISTIIKVYAFLRENISYKFTEPECDKMCRLFTNLPVSTDQDMRLVTLALCLIISSIQQLANFSAQISSWLKSLTRNSKLFTQFNEANLGQFLLLIAIHFHSNQLGTVSEMVAQPLGIKPSSVKLSNTILKQIITHEVFTEQIVSQLAVQMPVTKRLNSNSKGYLPIHCVCQLLKSRAFSKYNVRISDWIFDQLVNLALPMHPMVVQMINLYVGSTMPHQHGVRNVNLSLEEDKIRQYFLSTDTHGSNLASQLALLYYVLSHQDTVSAEIAGRKKSMQGYSSELISCIHTRYLANKAYDLRKQCASIYPSLVKLMSVIMPHTCKAETWFPEAVIHRRHHPLLRAYSPKLTGSKCSVHEQYLKLRMLGQSLDKNELPVIIETIQMVLTADIETIPRHMTMVLREIWFAYSRIEPERLYLETINAFSQSFKKYTEDQIVTDPLVVLRCLHRCSRQPDLISILLHLVDVYVRASNRFYKLHSQSRTASTPASVNPSEASEICYSLLAAQESSVLQILLEQCLTEEEADGLLNNIREIQCLICSHIHRVIIDEPNLARLISFQGYSSAVIPVAVAGIPSLHICLDYIPELLAQPDISKQVFAVRLTSALCHGYNIHKTYGMAKLCINTLITLIGVIPVYSVVRYIIPVMGHVASMCQDMPILYEDWITLLSKLVPIIASLRGQLALSTQEVKHVALHSL